MAKQIQLKKLNKCCELCGESNCKCKDKKLKVYFCPKCKSNDVGYIFTLGNLFGIIPRMRCKKCRFEAIGFPILIVSKNKLEKLNKKAIK